MTPKQSRYLMIGGGLLALAGIGLYLMEKRKQVAPTSITNGVQPDPLGGQAGPGYPFVTGGGSPGGSSSILCPDGTLVADQSLCPPSSGSGTGGDCGQHGQQCCQNNTCQAGLTCHLGQCLTQINNTGGQCSSHDVTCPSTGTKAFNCTCGDGKVMAVTLVGGNAGNCPVGSTSSVFCGPTCMNNGHCGAQYQSPAKNPNAHLASVVTPFGAAR